MTLNEAMALLEIGKRINKDGKTYSLITSRNTLCVWKDAGGDLGAGWHRLSEGIPIEWINATDFELVED